MKNPEKNPFEGGVIAEMLKRGEKITYSYPDNGLPELAVKSAPAWSPLFDAASRTCGAEEHAMSNAEIDAQPAAAPDPFEGCIIAEKLKRGEQRAYSYPDNGLPELAVESAPAWSPFSDAAKTRGADEHAAPDAEIDARDPFEGCVIAEMLKRGEKITYSYPDNGLPELTVKSAPAWSPFFEARSESEK